MGSVPVFLLLFAATHLVHSADPRAELRGRVVDAASGKPLEGAVVVASWIAEPAPNPLVVIIGLTVGGHGPGSRLRLGRVAETQSAADGTFVFPAWTHADQINSGMIVDGSRAVMAFLPGYAPRRWSADEAARGVLELRRYGSGPDGAVASLTSFRSWLAANVTSADPEGVGRSEEQVLVMPGQRRDESYEEKQARLAQQTAIRMVREELARLDPQADKDLSSMRQSVLDAP